jgi:hypothetical protein
MPNSTCAGVGNALHICTRKPDGRFFHAIRLADGSWNGFNDGSFIANANDIAEVSCAGVGNELHVCLRKNNGAFFHAIRLADGSWNGFNDGSFIANANDLAHFIFDPDITPAQRNILLERHRFAMSRILGCGNLNQAQRTALLNAYRRSIRHSTSTTPNVNASAIVGGSQIWVNFGVLFPQGNNEIAQTLIHEMMHCAGFTHPNRQRTDVPFDNGPYYSTPPLQAEICIAGNQSDVFLLVQEKASQEECFEEDGVYTIRNQN